MKGTTIFKCRTGLLKNPAIPRPLESFHLGVLSKPVSLSTRQGLDGPGVESQWRRDLSYPSTTAPVPTHSYAQWVLGRCHEDKAAEAWRWPPTLSRAEVKERVKLYFYCPSGPSWPVIGRNLPLSLPLPLPCLCILSVSSSGLSH